jgi:hypothetical protein
MKSLFSILLLVVLSIVVCKAYEDPESWYTRVQENKKRSAETLSKNLNTALELAIQQGAEVFSVSLSAEDLIFYDESALIAAVYEKVKKDLASIGYIFGYDYACGRMQIRCVLRWERAVLLARK